MVTAGAFGALALTAASLAGGAAELGGGPAGDLAESLVTPGVGAKGSGRWPAGPGTGSTRAEPAPLRAGPPT